MRKKLVITLVVLISAILFFIPKPENLSKKLFKEEYLALGTYLQVISPDKDAGKIVFDEIKRIESLLSKYDPDSEVSRLNRTGVLKTSPETFYIVKKSKEFYSLTNGAFDITVAPLVDIWGFTEKKYEVPLETNIIKTLKLVGSDKIILREKDFVIQFKTSGMKIDLGAIAKGYAVDCAVKKLKEHGIKSCLINAGGQIYCLGDRLGKPWRIGIKNPRSGKVRGKLRLRNRAIATSGDYEQYFFKDEKRYTHIINPKTGFPVENAIASVTVLAPDSTTADALSTAIFVLGKDKIKLLTQRIKGIEIRVIEK